ncbi:MAG: DUF4013 domain-containing protein [Actinobacteria bacterium]|nr:DUF4013 domain-containing protein [Actinomycetota bacterium]
MDERDGSGPPPECEEHPGVPAAARCVGCGRLMCDECAVERDRMYCASCAPVEWTPGPAARAEPPADEPTPGGEAVAPPLFPPVPPVAPPRGGHGLVGIDIARAFGYMLDDPDWVGKFLLGVLFCAGSILILPFFILLGYELELIRRVAAGNDRMLPEWDDLGLKLKEGAELFVIVLVYALPYLVILLVVLLLGFVMQGGIGSGVTAILRVIAVLLFFFGWLLLIVTGLVLRLAFPAFAGTCALTREMKQALQPRRIYSLVRADIQKYLVVFVFTWLVTGFIASAGFIICCVGVFFTGFYAILVNSHFYGQLARSNPAFSGPAGTDEQRY